MPYTPAYTNLNIGTSTNNNEWLNYWTSYHIRCTVGFPTTASVSYWSQGLALNEYPEVTEEQAMKAKCDAEEHHRKEKARNERADNLLLSLLDDTQRQQWAEKNHFDVSVNGKLYRLRKHSRVNLVENGEETIGYCIHPDPSLGLPAGDVVIAQKLLLESDEAAFLKTANATPNRIGNLTRAYNPANLAAEFQAGVQVGVDLAEQEAVFFQNAPVFELALAAL